MPKIDEIALNIELVVISIIEGVALSFLGESAAQIFHRPDWLVFLPYIISGFIILMVFFSQATLHVVSFIRWPLRMDHVILYFLASFLQMLAYSNITDISSWFLWWALFSLVVFLVYWVDLTIIREQRGYFSAFPGGSAYIEQVEKRHRYEYKFLVPLSLVFNVIAVIILFLFPTYFQYSGPQIILGILQLAVSAGALWDCLRNFKKRAELLPRFFTRD